MYDLKIITIFLYTSNSTVLPLPVDIGGKIICTTGFAVKGKILGDSDGLLIAGHCTTNNTIGDPVHILNSDGARVGEIISTTYGDGVDYGLIKLAYGWKGSPSVIGPGKEGSVSLPILSAISLSLDSPLCLTGATSNIVCGKLVDTDQSLIVYNKWDPANYLYLEGLNIIDTGANRVHFGDSGAAVYFKEQTYIGHTLVEYASAVGIFVAFNNEDLNHIEAYYYSIAEILNYLGLELITQHIK
ncbi:10988_t:CDS:2 [Diversispora eburnea]|uniref:10988_t:CDS:1 n=1 Tax=Diversispora eburnea TaxID=1213867 RepID=A0A9N9GCY3_9GLOM|nr:10988_t:CDS:2 [Diversispora eburnea]